MLRDSNLFELLTDDELHLLVSRATEIQVPAGTNLLTEGETCSHIFWLIAGTVNVLAQGETIAQVDSVQCFGELPCLSQVQRVRPPLAQSLLAGYFALIAHPFLKF